MLPSKYWYFALKRSVEVLNMMPRTHNGTITTPFEQAFHIKPDYRNLLPMFCTAYIRQERDTGGQHKNSWSSKSLKCILVGKCNSSDSLLFYHPPSKQTLSCADGFRLDTVCPPGPQFSESYDGDFIFTTRSALDVIHRPPTHEQSNTVFTKHDEKYYSAKVLSVPIDDNDDPYILQLNDTDEIIEAMECDILDHDPSSPTIPITTSSHPFPEYTWIQHNAKVTLYLSDHMPKPKQGHLVHDTINNTWTFSPGHHFKQDILPLPNFPLLVSSLIINKKLFKGWVPLSRALTARRIRATSNVLSHLIVNGKVSASNLDCLNPPTLKKHHKLTNNDQMIWDAAYMQEFKGLEDIETWEYISEKEYQDMKHILGNLLPTMAITTIKKDENGTPIRAKYRIVVLGNLDPHEWSKTDCFAPVLSHLELRFLIAIACHLKAIPKSGDVSQAFCQSFLPTQENYVLHPPPGCPFTPPNTYLKLRKTLYGLKRSPRHFYDLAKKHLLSMGLKQHPYSNCIFYGTLIPDQPPIYIGLYVDDFIYFSQSNAVEKQFETKFSATMPMEFNGEIQHFLGIKFTCTKTNDNVTIHMGQEAFTESLVQAAGLDSDAVNCPNTPYKSGLPVDKIPIEPSNEITQHKQNRLLQFLVGSLTWLSTSTRPDIATITNMLARYNHKASGGHINHAKYVVKYLKGTASKGITFSTHNTQKLSAYVKFPITPTLTALSDANWGPQDASTPKANTSLPELDLFKSRSISGFLLWLHGPLHWQSKRQAITARSLAEVEIYATDECLKQVIHVTNLIEGLLLDNELLHLPTPLYNDNSACVCWSKSTTTKGLRHIQIRENAIRESVINDFVSVQHIAGKDNLSDMFTKEEKDVGHFLKVRDFVVTEPPQSTSLPPNTTHKDTLVSSVHSENDTTQRQGGVRLGIDLNVESHSQ